MTMIKWTPNMLQGLKKQQKEAKEMGQTSFIFYGNEFNTGYADYLIQYLEIELGDKKNENKRNYFA